ncbi:hypothetical protein EDC01DRAFT_726355 [Geopyxis carbonaria]|nr:hypothetical protein EDC01DRAFT_726355 [Geopyxis carbonaria]
MYTLRSLSSTDDDPTSLFFPALRKINYSDSAEVRFVSAGLRHAWRAPAPATLDNAAIAAAFRASLVEPRELADDQATVHTPWRDALYEFWNHVFWDVVRFLGSVGPGIGHLHPEPRQEVFAVCYGVEVVRTWETNVLLLPAVRMQGAVVRVWMGEGEKREEVGRFGGPAEAEAEAPEAAVVEVDVEDVEEGKGVVEVLGQGEAGKDAAQEVGETECWFVKAGKEVRFLVERPEGAVGEGAVAGEEELAAVMVWTPLCLEEHE